MYRDLFDEKHRIVSTDIEKFEPQRYFQSGIYENNLFCKRCDNEILGSLEKYGSIVLFGSNNKSPQKVDIKRYISPTGVPFMQIESINYQKFKLFLLSILWRASISKHEFFQNVRLGPYNEVLRKAILNFENLPEEKFRICLIFFNDKLNEQIDKLISPPKRVKKGICTLYIFYLSKLFYFFEINNKSGLEIFDYGSIKKDNTMQIPIINNKMYKSFLNRFYGLNLR
jgi:hypothetical protein